MKNAYYKLRYQSAQAAVLYPPQTWTEPGIHTKYRLETQKDVYTHIYHIE